MSLASTLRAHLIPAESAGQLAALRIAVPLMILTTQEVRNARAIAAISPALRVAPEGLAWFVAHVPISPTLATIVQSACVFAALASILGLRARIALTVLTVTTFYLFAISQLSGAVWHDMHLVWMAALLAASPCDEALAYDPRHRAAIGTRSLRYGVPLFFARLLLACIYFFPGFHKLHTSGLDWIFSDNLRNQLWWKWAEHDMTPLYRIDRVPWMLHASAIFVIAFELSFPILALTRRGRPFAAIFGLLFHGVATIFFRIPFVSLWALYVVLVDPCALVRRVRRIKIDWRIDPAARALRSTWIFGSIVAIGAFVQGARGQMRSFPFACYPTFEWIPAAEMPDLAIEIDTTTRTHVMIPHGARTQREWGEIWNLAGVMAPIDPTRLRAYYESIAASDRVLRSATHVRMYRAYVDVNPDAPRGPPRVDELLTEFNRRTE